MKSSKKLRRATKSNNGHQSWKNQNGQEKTKTSNEGHKKSKWKPGLTHGATSLLIRGKIQEDILLAVCYTENTVTRISEATAFFRKQKGATSGRWSFSQST